MSTGINRALPASVGLTVAAVALITDPRAAAEAEAFDHDHEGEVAE